MFRKLALMLVLRALCSMLMFTTTYAGCSITYQYDADNRLLAITFHESGVTYKQRLYTTRTGTLSQKQRNL